MKKQEWALYLLMLLTPFCVGGYLVWSSALAACVLLLLLRGKGERMAREKTDWVLAAFISLPVMLLAAGLWGVDRGQAWFGFVKFIPLPLFCLAVRQIEPGRLWDAVSAGGVLMTVVSLVLWCIPATRDAVQVNGRLAGFFQYPNTYAAYLLCGFLAMTETGDTKAPAPSDGGGQRWARYKRGGGLVLAVGMLLSGSRTALALAAVAAVVLLLRSKTNRKAVLPVSAGVLALSLLLLSMSGNGAMLKRFLVLPSQSSTFLGRLLYAADALPVIARHPLGLGYNGYYYLQGSFQTGVYATRYVHNELLQLLLDAGWLPAALFAMAIWKTIRGLSWHKRLLLLLLLAHSLFDFDFQFLSMGLILALLLTEGQPSAKRHTVASSPKTGKKKGSAGGKRLPTGFGQTLLAAGLAAICLWVGLTDVLVYIKRPELAVRVFPLHTECRLQLLAAAETPEEMERIALQILDGNRSAALAYDALALVAYAKGDAKEMIAWKQQAIALARYDMERYEEYFERLFIFWKMYLEAGMTKSAAYCRDRLLEIPDMLQQIKEDSSPLAWRIYEKPALELSEEMQRQLQWLRDWTIP